ncbi:MAG: hypothetical protein O3A47_12505 [Chloroflexi bacterium]|nr:hypothetical protein [Chloroflexota bacterium]
MAVTQILFIVGALLFMVLGVAHGAYTWIERTRPFRLTPRNPEVRDAMKGSTLAIHPSTNVWRAWLGFNFSHSLGAVTFGVVYLILTVSDFSVITANLLLLGLPVIVSGIYLVLAIRYWFIIPLVGIALGFGCFMMGALLSL